MRTSVGTPRMRRAVIVWMVAALSCALLPGAAHAVPSTKAPTNAAIEAKRQEAAAATRRLQDLGDELEMRAEEYNEIEAALEKTRAQIVTTRAELEQASGELDIAQSALSERAASIYRSGDVSLLEVLLGVRDFGQFLRWLDFTRQIARSDASAVRAVSDAKAGVELAEQSLEARESEQSTLRAQAREKRAEVQRAVARQRAYVAGLNSDITKLIAEERVRLARIAAERARKAAAAAARLRTRAASEIRHFDGGELGGGHPEVVGMALKYIGVPYVWGGATPSGFDCSGLTQYVYAEAGISIPRTSRSQFAAGSYVPSDRLDLLRAGDLVFFGYEADQAQIHHVGVYVGDGNFIHAPQTGDSVQVSSLQERIASRGDYVGACRF